MSVFPMKSKWSVRVLSLLLVGVIIWGLLPDASAFEPICGIQEHEHTQACYARYGENKLACDYKQFIHSHDSGCYDSDENQICGKADFVLHKHDSSCYDGETLVCDFEEYDSTVHESVYFNSPNVQCVYAPRFGHMHDKSCYVIEKVLVCGQDESGHIHDDSCYEKELTCGIEILYDEEQGIGVTETETVPENSELPSGDVDGSDLEEVLPLVHEHTDSCYSRRLVCGQEETGHVHDDPCYEIREILTCGEFESWSSDADSDGGMVICHHWTYEEHTHDGFCGSPGDYTCGKIELKSHQHSDICFEREILDYESETPTCNQDEHKHSISCYFKEKTEELDAFLQAYEEFENAIESGEMDPENDAEGVANAALQVRELAKVLDKDVLKLESIREILAALDGFIPEDFVVEDPEQTEPGQEPEATEPGSDGDGLRFVVQHEVDVADGVADEPATFEFVLAPAQDSVALAGTNFVMPDSTSLKIDGSGTGTFGPITFLAVGEYEFDIKAVVDDPDSDSDSDWMVDGREFRARVSVTETETGFVFETAYFLLDDMGGILMPVDEIRFKSVRNAVLDAVQSFVDAVAALQEDDSYGQRPYALSVRIAEIEAIYSQLTEEDVQAESVIAARASLDEMSSRIVVVQPVWNFLDAANKLLAMLEDGCDVEDDAFVNQTEAVAEALAGLTDEQLLDFEVVEMYGKLAAAGLVPDVDMLSGDVGLYGRSEAEAAGILDDFNGGSWSGGWWGSSNTYVNGTLDSLLSVGNDGRPGPYRPYTSRYATIYSEDPDDGFMAEYEAGLTELKYGRHVPVRLVADFYDAHVSGVGLVYYERYNWQYKHAASEYDKNYYGVLGSCEGQTVYTGLADDTEIKYTHYSNTSYGGTYSEKRILKDGYAVVFGVNTERMMPDGDYPFEYGSTVLTLGKKTDAGGSVTWTWNGSESVDSVKLKKSGKTVYIVIPLPDKVNTEYAADNSVFYQKLVYRAGTSEERTFYFNPHFAKTVVAGTVTGGLYHAPGEPPVPQNEYGKGVSIRTPRHFFSLSRFQENNKDRNMVYEAQVYYWLQELDIDYTTYEWYGSSDFIPNDNGGYYLQPSIGIERNDYDDDNFFGTYDGGGHTIRSVFYETPTRSLQNLGLFKYVQDIRNVIYEVPDNMEVYLTAGLNVITKTTTGEIPVFDGFHDGIKVGTLAGGCFQTINCNAKINNFTVTCDSADIYVGGLFGYVNGYVNASSGWAGAVNCHVVITGTLKVDRIGTAGSYDDDTHMGNPLDVAAGGLTGVVYNCLIKSTSIVNKIDVSGNDYCYVGGLVGCTTANIQAEGENRRTVRNCAAAVKTLNVTGTGEVYGGGLLGWGNHIYDCLSYVAGGAGLTVNGATVSESGAYGGGLAGGGSDVQRCVAVAETIRVSGVENSYGGGLVGGFKVGYHSDKSYLDNYPSLQMLGCTAVTVALEVKSASKDAYGGGFAGIIDSKDHYYNRLITVPRISVPLTQDCKAYVDSLVAYCGDKGYIGGFVGWGQGVITNCTAYGTVAGYASGTTDRAGVVGGFVGETSDIDEQFGSCVAYVDVYGDDVGGDAFFDGARLFSGMPVLGGAMYGSAGDDVGEDDVGGAVMADDTESSGSDTIVWQLEAVVDAVLMSGSGGNASYAMLYNGDYRIAAFRIEAENNPCVTLDTSIRQAGEDWYDGVSFSNVVLSNADIRVYGSELMTGDNWVDITESVRGNDSNDGMYVVGDGMDFVRLKAVYPKDIGGTHIRISYDVELIPGGNKMSSLVANSQESMAMAGWSNVMAYYTDAYAGSPDFDTFRSGEPGESEAAWLLVHDLDRANGVLSGYGGNSLYRAFVETVLTGGESSFLPGGSLRIEKCVVDGNNTPVEDCEKKFAFHIEMRDSDGMPLQEGYAYNIYKIGENPPNAVSIFTGVLNHNMQGLWIPAGCYLYAEDLPVGTRISLSESEADLLSNGFGQVSVTNNQDTEPGGDVEITSDGGAVLVFTNGYLADMPKLPETGGEGVYRYMISGVAALGLVVVLISSRSRKRKYA